MSASARRLTDLLGIDVPIVLAPFGGLSSVELAGAVSDLGGLGSYGLYGYDAGRIESTVAELRSRTARPFALNLWLSLGDDPAVGPAAFERYRTMLRPFFDELGLELPEQPERFLPSFEEQIEAVLTARPAAVSFVYGVPPAAVVERARKLGIVVIGTATTVQEAVALAAGGVDAITATGAEAAGHRVSFLRPAEDSLVGALALVPQVVDAVDVPVIAAGGIADRRGAAAAFALGASGIQVGTAFLHTRESAANDAYRQAIGEADADGTVLTRAMSGRLARGIPNRAMRTIEAGEIAPFPVQNWLTGRFRAEAARRGIGDLLSLWAGQAAPLAHGDTAAAAFAELAAGIPGEPDRAPAPGNAPAPGKTTRPYVVLLSGPSSSGKTTTARALRALVADAPVLIEADAAFPVLSAGDEPADAAAEPPIMTFHRGVALWSAAGHDVILDGSLPGDPELAAACLAVLRAHCSVLHLVDVAASVDRLRERESSRPDARIPGFAETQIDLNERLLPYVSARVDTSASTPEEAAAEIARQLGLPTVDR